MRLRPSALAAVLLFALVGCVQTGATDAELLFDSGNYERAAETYRDFIRANEKSAALPEAYIGLAWCEYKLGRFDEAREVAELMRTRFPTDRHIPQAGYLVSLCYFERQRFTEAIEELQNILLYTPEDPIAPDARFLLARTHAQLMRHEKSEESFRIYIERYARTPYLAQALLGRADALTKLGRWEEAISVFEEYVSRFPRHPDRAETLMTLAELLRVHGRLDRSIELLEELRDHHPDWNKPRILLGEIAGLHAASGRLAEAAEIYEDLFRVTPDEEVAEKARQANWLAEYHATIGDTETARAYYARIADGYSDQPSHPLAVRWLMNYELGRGRREIAVKHATFFLERYYNHPFAEDVQTEIIDLLARSGRKEDARDRLTDLIRRQIADAEPEKFLRLAGLEVELGRYDEARKAANEGLNRARRSGDTFAVSSALNYLMISCKLLGRTGDATSAFWELQDLNPDYLTADEVVYWKAVEEQFFKEANVPPEFATKETWRSDWQIAVHFDGIDPVHADSTTVALVTGVSRLFVSALLQDDAFRRVPEKDVKLGQELIARENFNDLPLKWYPLRSTIGADWIVHGRVTLDPIREETPISLQVRMLRIDYDGIFPFEYWYHFSYADAVSGGSPVVRDIVEKLKLYRPDR